MEDFIAAILAYEGELQSLNVSEEPLWILGKQYDTREDLASIREDLHSRVWLTYRQAFPALPGPLGQTSDRGWGCMLRCGQMLLAEAMVRRHLGRSWRWTPSCRDPVYLRLLRMFEDQPLAPYSLHVMTSVGRTVCQVEVGEWYGPSTVALLIRQLPDFDMWNKFVVSVVNNNMLIVDDTRKLSKASHPNGWDPLIILIPVRLGMSSLNPIYIPYLKKCLRVPHCLGLLGGTPSHALFLVGFVGDNVIYLDPHTTQDAAEVGEKTTEEQTAADDSYHCQRTPQMPLAKLDPSMALSFLCNTEKEFDSLMPLLRSELQGLLEVHDTLPYSLEEDSDRRATSHSSPFKPSSSSSSRRPDRSNTSSDHPDSRPLDVAWPGNDTSDAAGGALAQDGDADEDPDSDADFDFL